MLEEERRLAYVGITRAKRGIYFIPRNEKSISRGGLDGYASFQDLLTKFLDDSVEKMNQVSETDFDFNQDNTLDFDEEYRSPGWIDIRKIKCLNGKNKKIKREF